MKIRLREQFGIQNEELGDGQTDHRVVEKHRDRVHTEFWWRNVLENG
jgi:hypothetical protein